MKGLLLIFSVVLLARVGLREGFACGGGWHGGLLSAAYVLDEGLVQLNVELLGGPGVEVETGFVLLLSLRFEIFRSVLP